MQDRKKRILVIDDAHAVRIFIGNMVESLGYELQTAENGKVALDAVCAGDPFDLALVDWNMPVMDGIEFIRTVRAIPGSANLRLVMVTTEASPEQCEKAIMYGANAFITKPFHTDHLQSVLKQQLAITDH